MATNFQQFGIMSEPSRWIHKVSIVSLENKIDQLTSIVYSLIAGRNEPSRVCGICTMPDHPTDYCPILQGETSEIVFADGTFSGPPQRPYNPYGNTYNPGWKDHPNFSYAQNQKPNQVSQQRSFQQHYQQPQKTSLELMIKKMAISQEKMMVKLVASQEKSESRFQELEKQTETNPANVSAITLRSGTIVEPKTREEDIEKDEVKEPFPTKQDTSDSNASSSEVPPPFPSRLVNQDKHAKEKEILDVFRKVEINIPLLEVIRKLPRYAPFLKEFCANKRKFSGHEKVNRGDNIFAVFTRRLISTLKNQCMFATPRKIHKISLKEVLSWTKHKTWRKLLYL
ncbi:hypothetical protein V6N13_092061 [Hibiscus sabdariffa]